MATYENPQDVVRLLEEDHQSVQSQLEALHAAPAGARGELFWKLTNDLVRHEVAEEVVVYPALRDVPGGDAIADARIAEQSEAEEKLARMEKLDSAGPEFAGEVAVLKGAVLEHAKAEEETAFAMLLSGLSPDRRVDLGQRYVKAKEAAPTHPHPHAPDTPPGNVVMGPLAALVDRVRDAAAGV